VNVSGAARRNRTFESPELLDLVAAFEKELALAELEPSRQLVRQRGPKR